MLRLTSATLAVLLFLGSMPAAGGPSGIWLDVPFVKQEKDGCGAASIAMVMQYWLRKPGHTPGDNANPVHIQHILHSRQAGGIYASAMENYLRQQNFRTFTFQGNWSDLEQHLTKGRPLIVMLKPLHHAPLHYVVTAGLDRAQKLILVNDPAQRKLVKLDWSSFEKSWNAAGNWTLLAVPQQAVP
jgi:ABC-type bacteriocin/lantibiotic exporter with double-glycine peptidase domain